jgi:CheY-like chemotaxis protein
MTPEVQARAFEPFYSTKGPGRGTGLGLSQVHGFAEQSGGSVAIESSPERGTAIILLLPRARGLGAASSPAQREPDATPGAGSILMVEDDDRVATVVCEMIEDLGYRVTRVANASQALAALEEEAGRFDLVFSDIAMPGGMNGIQLAAAIRDRRPTLPVLLTTGYSSPAEYTSEPFSVLQKPYGVKELSDALRAALPMF